LQFLRIGDSILELSFDICSEIFMFNTNFQAVFWSDDWIVSAREAYTKPVPSRGALRVEVLEKSNKSLGYFFTLVESVDKYLDCEFL
jgi:hypothetical protein